MPQEVDVPTYVYQCDDCGHRFEVFQSITADPVETCEECSGPVSRLLFAPAIHFKGTGFHNTDYGTKRRPVGGDGDGGSSGGDSGGAAKPAEGGGAAKESTSTPAPSSGKTIGLDKA